LNGEAGGAAPADTTRTAISGLAVPAHLGMSELIASAKEAIREEAGRIAALPHAYEADDIRDFHIERERVNQQAVAARQMPDVYRLLSDFVEAAEITDERERAAWTNYCVARARRLLSRLA
jgi:hypothetical protein